MDLAEAELQNGKENKNRSMYSSTAELIENYRVSWQEGLGSSPPPQRITLKGSRRTIFFFPVVGGAPRNNSAQELPVPGEQKDPCPDRR